MNRRILLVLVLAGAGAAAYFLFSGDKHAATPSTTSPSARTPDRPDRAGPQTPGARPRTPLAAPDRQAPEIAAETTERQLEDGTIVRDHRTGAAGDYIRPSLPNRADSPVTPAVTAALMTQLRPVLIKCMSNIPDSAFGAKPLVETRAVVQIDDQGELTVLELGPAVADIDEEQAATALDCVRDAAASIHTHVDHAAVPSATLAFAFHPLDYRRHAR